MPLLDPNNLIDWSTQLTNGNLDWANPDTQAMADAGTLPISQEPLDLGTSPGLYYGQGSAWPWLGLLFGAGTLIPAGISALAGAGGAAAAGGAATGTTGVGAGTGATSIGLGEGLGVAGAVPSATDLTTGLAASIGAGPVAGDVTAAGALNGVSSIPYIGAGATGTGAGLTPSWLQTVAPLAAGAIAGGSSLLAANTQANAANNAMGIEQQESNAALNFLQQQQAQNQTNLQPWLTTGTNALGQLSGLMAPGGALTQGFDPSQIAQYMDPSTQFMLQQGEQAINRSAAAQGGALSGGTLKALEQYAQGTSLGAYNSAYQNAFNAFEANQTNLYNRLAGMAGLGQTAATTLGSTGTNLASQAANTATTTGANLGNLLTQGANATASGYVGAGNAATNALGNLSNNTIQLALLSKLLGGNP